MLPKHHRRTPSSAHTYRLLIFKELIRTSIRWLSPVSSVAKRFVCNSKEAELCGLFVTSSSGLLITFYSPLKPEQRNLTSVATFAERCVRRGEPKIMRHLIIAVKQLG
jgi:hypothetical protein